MNKLLPEGGRLRARLKVERMKPLQNIGLGLVIAIAIGFTLAVPRIGTVSTWKIVLGVIGLAVFVLAGRERPGSP